VTTKPYLPIDEEAERAVLAAALTSPENFYELGETLGPNDFGIEAHRLVFTDMVQADAAGRPVDVITVADELRRMRALTKVGGSDGLTALTEAAAGVNLTAHRDIVSEKSTLRRLVATGRQIAGDAANAEAVARDVLETAEQLVFEIGARRDGSSLIPMTKAVAQTLQELAKVRTKLLLGHPSGLADLDRLTGGFQPGQLIIIAARPGVGKSAFALQLARHMAESTGMAVPFLSYEMGASELTMRMLATSLRYDLHRLRQGDLPAGMERDLAVSAEKIATLPMLIDESPPVTISGVRSAMRRQARRGEIAGIFIDYLQLMEGDGRSRDPNRVQEIATISRGLKRLATELGVPVIALSQLSRNLESRPNKRPMLSDLRESGSLEQDASLVLFLYRDYLYNPGADPDLAECIIAKQRNGPTGTVWLDYQPQCAAFATTNRRGSASTAAGSGSQGGYGGQMRDPF
jgi:replicative DNA helicase